MQDQEPESYSLKLEGRGISISRDVGQEVARAVLDIVLGGTVRTRPGNIAPERNDARENRDRPEVTLHESVEESGAKRNPDKIAVIGRYIIEHEGRPGFSRDEVKGRFRDAGEAIPANFGRDFNWAVRNGWIAEDHSARGEYYITKKGIEAIDGQFSSEITKKTAQKKGVSRRRAKKGSNQSDKSGEDE